MAKIKKQKNKSYQEVRDTWYRKLEKSGFQDIETNEFNLKNDSNIFTKKKTKYHNGGGDAKYEYFYMARQFLNDYKFKNKREEIIWAYWSEGMSVEDIAETLQKTKIFPKKFTRNMVWYTLKPLKEKMLEMYLVK